ncbi:hypothetical protein Scep_021470 [Stephania cephalantha]|uniref:Uncharacterized protein n=1 Tax=Stephania cephalantha TaxID=152367 RepID=A0AAP0I1F8_9MAGN
MIVGYVENGFTKEGLSCMVSERYNFNKAKRNWFFHLGNFNFHPFDIVPIANALRSRRIVSKQPMSTAGMPKICLTPHTDPKLSSSIILPIWKCCGHPFWKLETNIHNPLMPTFLGN